MARIIRRAATNAAARVQEAPSDVAAKDHRLAKAIQVLQPVVETVTIEDLKPSPRNARRHPKKQVQQVAASIDTFGFVVPIIVDENGNILAGHARYEAAKLLGMRVVLVIRVKHLTPERKRAFMLADNRADRRANLPNANVVFLRWTTA